jgi:hypothetical protein
MLLCKCERMRANASITRFIGAIGGSCVGTIGMVYPGTLFIGDNGAFLCIPMNIGIKFRVITCKEATSDNITSVYISCFFNHSKFEHCPVGSETERPTKIPRAVHPARLSGEAKRLTAPQAPGGEHCFWHRAILPLIRGAVWYIKRVSEPQAPGGEHCFGIGAFALVAQGHARTSGRRGHHARLTPPCAVCANSP